MSEKYPHLDPKFLPLVKAIEKAETTVNGYSDLTILSHNLLPEFLQALNDANRLNGELLRAVNLANEAVDTLRARVDELEAWVARAHHLDGCQVRYKRQCDCGRDALSAREGGK